MTEKKRNPITFIRQLCKDKPEQEIQEAEERFRNYLLIVKDVYESIERNKDSPGLDNP